MSNEAQQVQQSGFMEWIQQQSSPVRFLIFGLLIVLVVLAIFWVTAFLFFLNIRNIPRGIPAVIPPHEISVSEFVTFDDAEAYPAAVAVAPYGTLYTASYVNGSVWAITPDGEVQEIPMSRAQIGSVVGLDVAADGTLYILDRIDPLQPQGATIWRMSENVLVRLIDIPPQGRRFVGLPNDIAVDVAGNLYVADVQFDLGRPGGRVLRIAAEFAEIEEWWTAPDAGSDKPSAPAGLAYDAAQNALIIADTGRNAIYRVGLDDDDPMAATTQLYDYEGDDVPGLNGVTVAPDGTIYVAALGLNRVARLEGNDLVYLVAGFRGGSDVAYDATNRRLFVNNWDQRWLLPVRFVFVSQRIAPRLPFSVDSINLVDEQKR